MSESVSSVIGGSRVLTANYHIHTHLSPCATDDMRLPQILDAAEKTGLSEIGITDHCYGLELNSTRLRELRSEVDQAASGRDIRVYFGVEAYIMRHRMASITPQIGALFDYVVMAPNHYNIRGVAQPVRLDPRILADHELYMLEAAVNHPATDIVAHPFVLSPRIFRVAPDRLAALAHAMMDVIDEKRLAETLDRMRQRDIAIELTPKMFQFSQVHLESFYRLCVERGVLLAYGGDSHDVDEIAIPQQVLLFADRLGITDDALWSPPSSL